MSDKTAATFHGSGPCPKSCCWTPYSCGRNWTCEHHREHAHQEAAAEGWQQVIRRAERESREAAKRQEGFAPWR